MTQPLLEENSVFIDLYIKNIIVDPLAGTGTGTGTGTEKKTFHYSSLSQAVILE